MVIPNGVEHLFAQMAKLIADDIPHKLTQRCLDTENPSCPFSSHIGHNARFARRVTSADNDSSLFLAA